jgi:hypothetical protein
VSAAHQPAFNNVMRARTRTLTLYARLELCFFDWSSRSVPLDTLLLSGESGVRRRGSRRGRPIAAPFEMRDRLRKRTPAHINLENGVTKTRFKGCDEIYFRSCDAVLSVYGLPCPVHTCEFNGSLQRRVWGEERTLALGHRRARTCYCTRTPPLGPHFGIKATRSQRPVQRRWRQNFRTALGSINLQSH